MALNVGIEHLNCVLGEKAFVEMLVILDQRQPGLQQPVVCFHVHHVVFIQLRAKDIHKTDGQRVRRTSQQASHSQTDRVTRFPLTKVPNYSSMIKLTELVLKLTDQFKHCSKYV